jgi:hypothetical protein
VADTTTQVRLIGVSAESFTSLLFALTARIWNARHSGRAIFTIVTVLGSISARSAYADMPRGHGETDPIVLINLTEHKSAGQRLFCRMTCFR